MDQVEVDVEQVGLVVGPTWTTWLVPHLLGQGPCACLSHIVGYCSCHMGTSIGVGVLDKAVAVLDALGGGAAGAGRAGRRPPGCPGPPPTAWPSPSRPTASCGRDAGGPVRPRPPPHRPGAAGAGPARAGAAAGRDGGERAALRAPGRPPAVRRRRWSRPTACVRSCPWGRRCRSTVGSAGQGPPGRRRRRGLGRERRGAGAGVASASAPVVGPTGTWWPRCRCRAHRAHHPIPGGPVRPRPGRRRPGRRTGAGRPMNLATPVGSPAQALDRPRRSRSKPWSHPVEGRNRAEVAGPDRRYCPTRPVDSWSRANVCSRVQLEVHDGRTTPPHRIRTLNAPNTTTLASARRVMPRLFPGTFRRRS